MTPSAGMMKMIDPRHCQTFCHARLVDPIAGIISCGKDRTGVNPSEWITS